LGFAICFESLKRVQRLVEAQVLDSLQEVQHVAMRAAAKTVEGSRLRKYRERRRVIVVERAKTHKGRSGRPEFDI
jgi:hypothetical protein